MIQLPEVHLLAGTRPEAIKLAPVAARIRAVGRLRPVLVATGQHPTMVAEALAALGERADVALELDRSTGSQPELLSQLVRRLDEHFGQWNPATVLVQGDTTTTLAGAMAAFWRQVPVVHLEAGLRSGDLAGPFPEEGNRKMVAQISRLHLAPTVRAAGNLLAEGTPADQVLVTGNTVVDAALAVTARPVEFADARVAAAERAAAAGELRLVLVTVHRRESWGEPLDRVLRAVRRLLARYPDMWVVLPAHPNPAVRAQVDAALAGTERAIVTDPLPYAALARILSRATIVLTDSGGIQEEAPSFGVPALVLRDVTERVESVEAGCAKLVGTDEDVVLAEAIRLLDDRSAYAEMVVTANPYGDGYAAHRTEQAIAAMLGLDLRPAPMPYRHLLPVGLRLSTAAQTLALATA
ncbi:MAG: UDP-N-acetylglucosamine 2-epimerase [Actinobacteria bacterium 13_2_20CM_2_71_6]|nr:MAG: UDP-N-acetylglucosamine 2-epimerase [Actinobacteria bacterium 13_2_20CM_2_71_6]